MPILLPTRFRMSSAWSSSSRVWVAVMIVRMRRGEQERPPAMIEELDEIARAANITAQRADGFRQRAHLHVHAAVQFEVVDGTAPVAAQHAGSVSVVHHHDGAVFFGQLGKLRQRANVAVHGEAVSYTH